MAFWASKIVNKTGEGVLLGMCANVGGFLFTQYGATGVSGLNFYSMFVAVIGAIVVLLIYHAVVRVGSRDPVDGHQCLGN